MFLSSFYFSLLFYVYFVYDFLLNKKKSCATQNADELCWALATQYVRYETAETGHSLVIVMPRYESRVTTNYEVMLMQNWVTCSPFTKFKIKKNKSITKTLAKAVKIFGSTYVAGKFFLVVVSSKCLVEKRRLTRMCSSARVFMDFWSAFIVSKYGCQCDATSALRPLKAIRGQLGASHVVIPCTQWPRQQQMKSIDQRSWRRAIMSLMLMGRATASVWIDNFVRRLCWSISSIFQRKFTLTVRRSQK